MDIQRHLLDHIQIGDVQLKYRRTLTPPPSGFSLIELMIVVSIAAFLMTAAVPFLGSAVSNIRSRAVIAKFTDDFASLRNVAATGGASSVSLVVSGDCSWAASVGGVANTAHSMAVTDITTQASGLTCTLNPASPVTFTFTPQGTVNTSAAITFTSTAGQTWNLQILNSGTLTNTKGTS